MKRLISIVVAMSSLALVALPGTAGAKDPKPQIEDIQGDANGINDQGTGDGSQIGDQNATNGPGTVSDILSVTFTNDKKFLYVNIRTQVAPPAATAVGFRIRTNRDGAGGTYCLFFEALYSGANNTITTPQGHVRNECAGQANVPVEVLGTQLKIPRDAVDGLGKGAKLTSPQALSFQYSGTYEVGVAGPMLDTTRIGTDFKFKG